MKRLRYKLALLFILLSTPVLHAQTGFSNETRALLILDISRYVRFSDTIPERGDFLIITVWSDGTESDFKLGDRRNKFLK